jgi:putative DNA primase/helicase
MQRRSDYSGDWTPSPKPQCPRPVDPRTLVALEPLTHEQRWVGWRWEYKPDKDKWTKPPCMVSGAYASTDDSSTWCGFDAVWGLNGHFDGLGFCLYGCPAADLAAIDIDKVRNPETGEILSWAATIANTSYCEITPSGTGLRVLGTASSIPTIHRNIEHPQGGSFELYANCKRYITITGQALDPNTPRHDITSVIRELEALAPANGHDAEPSPDVGADIDIDIASLPSEVAELITEGTDGGIQVRKRGLRFMSVVRYLRQKGHGFQAVLRLLEAHPKGVQSKYLGEKRLEKELKRAWDKIPAPRGLPTIVVDGGSRHKNADAGLSALNNARVPFYRRGIELVRVATADAKASDGSIVKVPVIAAVDLPILGRALGQHADWMKQSGFCLFPVDPPDDVVKQILAMFDEWTFPSLLGVIGTPTLRPDGSLLATEGYDDATGLVLAAAPPMTPIPDQPTKDDAEAALALLDGLLNEFPFVFDNKQTAERNPSRSVALSALMTPVVRGTAPVVPAHFIDAPDAGTGKSYLVDLVSALAVGDRAAVLAFSHDPAETEKRLIAVAMEGRPIIALDNCSGVIAGDFLCQVTERALMTLRPLGTSVTKRVGNAFNVFVNGNNAVIAADMVRRTLKCSMDANTEEPENRTFTRNPLAEILANRGKYIAAVLTVCRAYICAGRPDKLPELASFEAWSNLVRSALVWLGRPDPVGTIAGLREGDPVREARANVFEAWTATLGTERSYQVSELISEAAPLQRLRDALLQVAADYKEPGTISAKRLGRWLVSTHKNIAGGQKLVADRTDKARIRWRLLEMKKFDSY